MNLIKEITNILKTTKIKCLKYNNSFEQKFSPVSYYPAEINLSANGEEIIIMYQKYSDPYSREAQGECTDASHEIRYEGLK